MKPMNDVLVKHYLDMPPIPKELKDSMRVVNSDNAHLALLNESGIDWTYEVVHEEYLEEGTAYHTMIALYVPGMVRIGVGKSNTDFNREHKFEAIVGAIKNACQTMRIGITVDTNLKTLVNSDTRSVENTKTEVQPPIQEEPKQQIQPVTKGGYTQTQVNRIQAFKKASNIETNEQFMNYVSRWNKDITTKSQLTPSNIDGFLDWIENIDNTIMDT